MDSYDMEFCSILAYTDSTSLVIVKVYRARGNLSEHCDQYYIDCNYTCMEISSRKLEEHTDLVTDI